MISSENISRIAFKALVFEVLAVPKPGLVDIVDSGSHSDMDYTTFINSSFAIADYFQEAFLLGKKNYNKKDFEELRERGKLAEKSMYNATAGVNTHKGTIFSLGLLVYSTGIQYQLGDLSSHSIVNRVKILCKNISEELKDDLNTAGGKQYKKYGLKGVRQEAEEGFCKSVDIGLFYLKKYMKTLSLNDALINTMMHFMSILDDSNLIKRGDIEGLKFARESAKTAIDLGLMNTEEGREYISFLNREFIKRNLSPGGTADYLILTLYLYFLEEL
jgi:triphosphoribosyl-dephospho-CoA synthase